MMVAFMYALITIYVGATFCLTSFAQPHADDWELENKAATELLQADRPKEAAQTFERAIDKALSAGVCDATMGVLETVVGSIYAVAGYSDRDNVPKAAWTAS